MEQSVPRTHFCHEGLIYMLKEKTGLSAYRGEMLDTLLGTSPDYGQVEAGITRLFGKIHEHEKPARVETNSSSR